MISSYKITEDRASVEYTNLYAINGVLYFLSVDDVDLPHVKKFTISYDWRPEVMKFNSEADLNLYVNSLKEVNEYSLSVLSDNLWYGNVGHGLFDVLYPIYLSLLKFGYSDESFNFLSVDWSWRDNFMYDVIKKFTKGDLIEYNKLDVTKVYKFNKLIAGTDLAGNRVVNKDVFIYGKKWDGLYNFKKRLFDVFDIKLDLPVKIDKPKVIIINNKRFNDKDVSVIKDAVNKLSGVCDIKFLNWQFDYGSHSHESFKKQMEDFKDVDIQVTAPGTAMMYVPLLKKGAVNINLGYIEHTQTNGVRGNLKIKESKHTDHLIPAYMEQPICAGTYYVTSLYYDRYKYNELEIEPLIEIINNAIAVLKKGEITEGNVGIDAQVFREYCKRSKDGDEICTHLTNLSLQVEFFVNHHPLALLPSSDMELLKLIKNELNYDRSYEINLD